MKTIIKTNGIETELYQNTCVYELMKRDLEKTGLFEHEDIVLGFLNINPITPFDDEYNPIQITQEDNTFKVRYLRETQIKTEKQYMFFTRKIKSQIWETIYYRIYDVTKINPE